MRFMLRSLGTDLVVVALGLSVAPAFAVRTRFDPGVNYWVLSNGAITAEFQVTADGHFRTVQVRDSRTNEEWAAPPNRGSSPIDFQVDDYWFDADTLFDLVEQSTQPLPAGGMRQAIVLRDTLSRGLVTVNLELYDGYPVLRYWVSYKNLTSAPVHVKLGNMLSWTFGDKEKRYTAMRVNQWSLVSKPANFEATATAVNPSGRAIEIYSGAHGEQCAWLALRDTSGRSLFAGWEFDGRAKATIRHSAVDGYVELTAAILDLYHPVAPGEQFDVPAAFIGLSHGDFDEAGYRTQRFAEAAIARPAPAQGFPFVGWDSWAYQDRIDEQTLRREAGIAASLGIELFTVDLGWAKQIGDWYADPDKFPNGLRALSDYVHSLGMKFGLHFALTEAAAASPVLQQNPDWTATENNDYHGAVSLCLSNQPTREWLIGEAIRMIDMYNPDWILQDGENMVKTCTRATHTHDPLDSNYSNAVDGLNYVVRAVQRERPAVAWENCEDGGNMMTFNMLRNYVTSITNDASGALSARQAVFGATYPFPPRYTSRYMPDEGLDSYVTGSYLFGGPWMIMRPLGTLTAAESEVLGRRIQAYKESRTQISPGKVFHIAGPTGANVDVIQSYNPATGSAVAVVSRSRGAAGAYLFKPRGLLAGQRYRVWLENDSRTYSQTGSQLMSGGVTVALPDAFSSDVVHIEKQ